MLEVYLHSPVTRQRLRAGPATDHIDGFANWLDRQGYKPTFINNLLRSLEVWTDWLLAAGFNPHDIDLPAGGPIGEVRGSGGSIATWSASRSI